MIDELNGSCIFSKYDLKSDCHQIQMNLIDQWKIVFKTKFCLYKWMVFPFSLTYASITFICLMNHAMKLFIGKVMVIYFDDIFVYAKP